MAAKSDVHIRDIELPKDRAAAVSFIMGSQRFERAFEPDRRIDPAVAEDYFAVLMTRVDDHKGQVLVAEEHGRAIGWAVLLVEEGPLFVVENQRTYGSLCELYVQEERRGRGVGRALISACEVQARCLGLGHIMIGVLAGNERAKAIYGQAGYAPYHVELRKYL
jgi:GNAT superfamily N-acetyltransferase